MADGDVPLVTSFGGSEIEFGANGNKVTRTNSRMSTLLFWQGKGKAGGGPQGRNWIHAPDALVKGHVAYLVKFLGTTQVDQPKGIEVVKEAIQKLQFNQQLKKSETKDAAKCKKVEITISVDGVAIQEPRSNNILHQFPLHRISYCADDKGAKKYFSFIAKGSIANGAGGGEDEKHQCFVFISTKLASEITLTIGQAFDLAYRRFLNDNGKYIEMQKLSLQNKRLELQLLTYKNRLQELSKITYKEDLTSYLAKNKLTEITEWKAPAELEKQIASLTVSNGFASQNGGANVGDSGMELSNHSLSETASQSNDSNLLLTTPPPAYNGKPTFNNKHVELMGDSPSKNPVVGTKLEGLLLNSDSDSDFDPRAFEAEPAVRHSSPFPAPPPRDNSIASPPPPLLAPPPKTSKRHSNQNAQNTQNVQNNQNAHNVQSQPPVQGINGSDLFGSTPFSMPNTTFQQMPPAAHANTPFQSKPNYDISDFDLQTSVFANAAALANGFNGYDPFDTQKAGNNIFSNGYGNAFNGFGNLSEKQTVELDSNFNGFLDKTISEMKDGFSRGITFGNDDFSIDNLDPLKKN